MASNSDRPLTETDITQFIEGESGFSLEMAALRVLRSLQMDSEHAAVYVDPTTGKMRAFDIRARLITEPIAVRLAVECKRIRQTAPLLVHATPRRSSEAFYSIVRRKNLGGSLRQYVMHRPNLYKAGEPVGRHTDQPTKDEKGKFKSSDAPTYEKWMQAVSGCSDLVRELLYDRCPPEQIGVVVPLLVVPAETLWQVDYDDDGTVIQPVRQVESTTLILRHSWQVQTAPELINYEISHLEIVTLTALKQRAEDLIATVRTDMSWLPSDD
jgi:hypothetical protein